MSLLRYNCQMGRNRTPDDTKKVCGLPRSVYRILLSRITDGPWFCDMRYVTAYQSLSHMLGRYGEVTGGRGLTYSLEIQRLKKRINDAEDGELNTALYARLVDHLKKNRTRRNAPVWECPVVHGSVNRRCLNRFGFTIDEFVKNLECKFLPGMNWDRVLRGDVQVDHEIPVRIFDLSTQAGIHAAYSLLNTQPLWRGDNARKGMLRDKEWIELFGEGAIRG